MKVKNLLSLSFIFGFFLHVTIIEIKQNYNYKSMICKGLIIS